MKNTPTDNTWLDELFAQAMRGQSIGSGLVATNDWCITYLKPLLVTHIDTVCREARIDELDKLSDFDEDYDISKSEFFHWGDDNSIMLDVDKYVIDRQKQLNPNKDTK